MGQGLTTGERMVSSSSGSAEIHLNRPQPEPRQLYPICPSTCDDDGGAASPHPHLPRTSTCDEDDSATVLAHFVLASSSPTSSLHTHGNDGARPHFVLIDLIPNTNVNKCEHERLPFAFVFVRVRVCLHPLNLTSIGTVTHWYGPIFLNDIWSRLETSL